MKNKKVVLTYGTFDMFHIGHLKLLKRLKSLGDELIVAVSTDEFNNEKGKKTLIPFDQRAEIVKSIKYVDHVIAEKSWKQKEDDIKSFQVDIFAMGDDWEGEFDHLETLCQVIYLPRTKSISTTALKKSLTNFLSIPKEDIIKAFEIIEQLKKDLE